MQALTYQPYYNPTDSQPELQRQLEYFPRQPRKRTLTWQITLSYPSPPMSSSPSPLRKLSDVPSTNTTSAVSLLATAVSSISASGTSAISLPPIPSNIAQATPSGSQPLPLPIEPVVSTAALPPLATRKPSSSGQGDVPLADTQSVSSVGVAPDAQTTAGPAPLASLSTAAAGGRRSKAHVANACSNCKRAHLSCDVDRPCNRCIQTGKTVCSPGSDPFFFLATANPPRTRARMYLTRKEVDHVCETKVSFGYINNLKVIDKLQNQPSQAHRLLRLEACQARGTGGWDPYELYDHSPKHL